MSPALTVTTQCQKPTWLRMHYGVCCESPRLHVMTRTFFKGQYHSSILPGNTDLLSGLVGRAANGKIPPHNHCGFVTGLPGRRVGADSTVARCAWANRPGQAPPLPGRGRGGRALGRYRYFARGNWCPVCVPELILTNPRSFSGQDTSRSHTAVCLPLRVTATTTYCQRSELAGCWAGSQRSPWEAVRRLARLGKRRPVPGSPAQSASLRPQTLVPPSPRLSDFGSLRSCPRSQVLTGPDRRVGPASAPLGSLRPSALGRAAPSPRGGGQSLRPTHALLFHIYLSSETRGRAPATGSG